MAYIINDAANFGAMSGAGRQVVRDSDGGLYAVLIDGANDDVELWSPFKTVTYYFDGSDVPADDPDNVWNNETNSDDGDTGTFADTDQLGTTSTNEIRIEGTNAPGTGRKILKVRARGYGQVNNEGADWGDWSTLNEPSGGWTWAKLQALEVQIYGFYSDPVYSLIANITTDGEGEQLAGVTVAWEFDNLTQFEVYKVEIEVSYVSPDGSDTWEEWDWSNKPVANHTPDSVAVAIDSNDTLHIAYSTGTATTTAIKYVTFSNGLWGTPEDIHADVNNTYSQIAIALDSNDKPHVSFLNEALDWKALYYREKTGGSWGSIITVDGGAGETGFISINITINDEDIPEIAAIDDSDDSLYAYLGNQNAATSFTTKQVDSSVNVTADQAGCSIAIDSSGNTWIAYVDSDSHICLYKHTGTDWATNWTQYDSGVTGYEPSIAIDGTDVYVFYQDDETDQRISYMKYDGSWSSEIPLETPGSGVDFQDVKAKWASHSDNTVSGVWDNGYKYRRRIVIDNTKVEGSSNLSNFPILVKGTHPYLADTGNGGKVTSSDGYDIIFTSDAAGSNILKFERQRYINTTGEVIFWVKIPTLPYNSDTTIYMFYGKSGESDQADAPNVWTAYIGVWHFEESGDGSPGEFKDAIGTNHGQGGSGDSGKTPTRVGFGIGYGQSFDGGDWIDLGDPTTWDGKTEISVECWMLTDNLTDNWNMVRNLDPGSGGFGLYLAGVSRDQFYFFVNEGAHPATSYCVATDTTILSATKYHVTATWKATQTMAIYVDGDAQAISDILTGTPANTGAPGQNMLFGGRYSSGAPDYLWPGDIDEIRIAASELTAGWTGTNYNTQSSPSTFYSLGIEETRKSEIDYLFSDGTDVYWNKFSFITTTTQTVQTKGSVHLFKTQTIQAKGQSHMFVELVDSNTYKDAGETDADWNLSLERIYLPKI